MKKILKKIINNWKFLFCYGLIGIGVLFFVVIFIKHPMKKVTNSLYDPKEMEVQKVSFPIKQKIKLENDNLSGFWLYFEDDSINEYIYNVTLTDSLGKKYFEHEFDGYVPNIIYMGLGIITDSKGMEMELIIECETCENVKLSYDKENETLKLASENYVSNNNIYYWHAIMAIVIGLVLLPLVKEDK